jgi:hypothetical protein
LSWQKHFQVVNTDRRLKKALARSQNEINGDYNGALGTKFSSLLPEVYAGHPLRIARYTQYDQMDMDSEVNTALDIIADFCTQKDENSGKAFNIVYNGNPSDTEVEILKTCLEQWSKINEFSKRAWRAFRSTLKYGDQFFIRDPETLKWFWVEQINVEKVIVNEATGKEIEAYLIRNLNINSTNLSATQSQTYGNNVQAAGTNTLNQLGGTSGYNGVGGVGFQGQLGSRGGRYGQDGNQSLTAVDATHVVHLSLSEGLDANWPFGTSILESIFKVFRQKELLEDAVVIYRIVRAPERRIFYIDVGQMPPHKASAYLEKVKNEMHQKRIPNRNSANNTITDTAYSPMSQIDDFYFAQCLSLETLIPLIDGRILALQAIIDEFAEGKINSVYGLNGEEYKIVWASKTRLDAEVIEVTLDNGNKIVCTPDHRFILKYSTEVEAQHLTGDMELMTRDFSICRIDSIRWLKDKIDTGDITIEGPTQCHIFALAAGVYVHNSSDGRGSKVDTLPGGENLGAIDDLRYFDNKLVRGLRIPSSYLPTGPDDGQQTYNDGRAGTAYIQEFRFAQYCMRLQSLIAPTFDAEFKLFVKQRGFNIDSALFEIQFTTPQHFSDYARAEKDAALINTFSPLTELSFFSKRWLMINKLGMTEAQVAENEEMWRQENPDAVENIASGSPGTASDDSSSGAPGLESMGIRDTLDTTGGGEDPDISGDTDAPPSNDSPISGAEAGGDSGAASQPGGL